MIRRRKKPRRGPDKSGLPFAVKPSPTKAERNAGRNARVRDLRFRVMRRARLWCGNLCEFCRNYEPVTMHHVLKGAERRALEDDATCAAVCELCDDRTENQVRGAGGPSWARAQAVTWARRLAGLARRRRAPELAERLDRTAEILEAKIALAESQSRPLPGADR